MSKRVAFLYVCLMLSLVLALVATSALASPAPGSAPQPPGPPPRQTILSSPSPGPVLPPIEPAPQPTVSAAKDGLEWKNICNDPDKLVVTVKGDNTLLYECIGTSLFGWSELCSEKAGIGYTDAEGPGISVTCGI